MHRDIPGLKSIIMKNGIYYAAPVKKFNDEGDSLRNRLIVTVGGLLIFFLACFIPYCAQGQDSPGPEIYGVVLENRIVSFQVPDTPSTCSKCEWMMTENRNGRFELTGYEFRWVEMDVTFTDRSSSYSISADGQSIELEYGTVIPMLQDTVPKSRKIRANLDTDRPRHRVTPDHLPVDSIPPPVLNTKNIHIRTPDYYTPKQ